MSAYRLSDELKEKLAAALPKLPTNRLDELFTQLENRYCDFDGDERHLVDGVVEDLLTAWIVSAAIEEFT